MKVRRETLLIAGLVGLLALVTAAAALFQAQQDKPPALSSSSTEANGALALRLWLSAAGYQVESDPGSQYAIPPGTAAVVILEPTVSFSAAEWQTLEDWVRQGGTLLLAGSRWTTSFSGNPFGLNSVDFAPNDYDLLPPAPFFGSPPLIQPAHLAIDHILNYAGPDGLALLAIPAGPVVWQIRLGEGQLLALADAGFLSNGGLKQGGNTALAINLFGQVPQGSRVYIDEWHHGQRVNNPTGYGPMAWLTQTPAGFAVLLAAGLIFGGLVLAGRPFGPRVALSKSQARRGSLDYVNAVANLNRRAGHRRAVMQSYRAELKRALGKRYRLDLDQADPDFIGQVLKINPALDGAGLTELMQRLSKADFSEIEMVRLARECAGWIEKNSSS